MQQSKFPDIRSRADVARHRIRSRLAGRARLVAPATVLAVGAALAGISAAVADGPAETPLTAAVTADQQARADAAQRADRAERATAQTAPAQTTPQAAPAQPAPTTAAPKAAPATAAAPKAATAAPKKAAPAWVSPMPGAAITSCFGQRWGVLHAGIDLAAPSGTPIHAVGAGTVVAAGWAYSGYGISVVIDHGNGYMTHYAHQSKVAVRIGQKVAASQVIGYEGSTGDSTGPHLHFEVHKGALWNQINPAPWLKARGIAVSC
ncbi:M23 family metallopeptidase [Micromonospora sp. CPCC 206061]|uniref:M23 family metallopeptidase n=1 Tax=Micromonospora sp. CPCC 206061 TaxID=3122410 RepID=UPI002FF013D4